MYNKLMNQLEAVIILSVVTLVSVVALGAFAGV